MKAMGILTKILTKRLAKGGVKMAKKSPAPPLADGIFDKVEQARSDFFTAGFAKTDVMPTDMDKKVLHSRLQTVEPRTGRVGPDDCERLLA